MLFKVYSAANRDIMQQLRIDRGTDHFNLSYFEAKDSDKLLLISPATGVKKRLYTQFAEYMQQKMLRFGTQSQQDKHHLKLCYIFASF